MRILFIVSVFILVGGCTTNNPLPNKVLLYGHGGGGFDNSALFPPNSVPAMKESLEKYRLDGIEVDVQFTQDTGLIVFHDGYLENATQCKGKINAIHLAEAAGCNFRDQYHNTYTAQVITFDSLVILMNTVWLDKYLSINLQSNFEVPYKKDSLAHYFHKKMTAFKSLEKVTIECNDANLLYFLERENKEYKSYLVANIDSNSANEVFRFKLDGIVSFFKNRDDQLEKTLTDSGKVIFLYGAKFPSDYARYKYNYITAVQVDNPILALKYFKNQ